LDTFLKKFLLKL